MGLLVKLFLLAGWMMEPIWLKLLICSWDFYVPGNILMVIHRWKNISETVYNKCGMWPTGIGIVKGIINCCTGTGARTMICLLYTSPSPRDGLLSRMPSSA